MPDGGGSAGPPGSFAPAGSEPDHAECRARGQNLDLLKPSDHDHGAPASAAESAPATAGEQIVSNVVAVDQPCLILINAEKQEVFISEPTQKLKEIRLTVGRLNRVVSLATAENAGKTVEVSFGVN